MNFKLCKPKAITLRSIGKDERWLQEQIGEDPSILGLGDLSVIERERTQASGGRIDFLMYNPEDGVRYEIEVMLGTLDESHIIRTIEYWDIERRRFPSLEHRAVIIAEDITNRFFNVISLLNNSIPIIAIQLNALTLGDSLMLNFTKVLDISESADEEDQGTAEQADRQFWEKRANKKSLAMLDKIISFVPEEQAPVRVTYNRSHVALGTDGHNFCWPHLRKGDYLFLVVRFQEEEKEATLQRLEDHGIAAQMSGKKRIKFKLTAKELANEEEIIREVIAEAEKQSRNGGG